MSRLRHPNPILLSLFDKPHDALFKWHIFSREWLTILWYLGYPSNLYRPLRLWKLNDPFSKKIIQHSWQIWIRERIFFSWSSFRIVSLKGVLLFSFGFGPPLIQTGSTLEMVIAFLVELVENLTFFLKSALSFFDSATLKELLQRLAMVTSISCALVTKS